MSENPTGTTADESRLVPLRRASEGDESSFVVVLTEFVDRADVPREGRPECV